MLEHKCQSKGKYRCLGSTGYKKSEEDPSGRAPDVLAWELLYPALLFLFSFISFEEVLENTPMALKVLPRDSSTPSKSVILEVWSSDQQQLHHLGTH